MTVHTAGDKVISSGDQVAIGFRADQCHLFHENGDAFERVAVWES